ncbi:MAG TPA: hypothetical protein VKV18_05805 [Chthonomonas sp.]|uniref:hypothetical protein n=1 Tax=Chthonomonas sp. TaxID=2282153 RepID=UPI002B4AC735|nr:hypothetical protein [Chthonomonas sp.]HLI48192.1 hypothetical protein [Chthonomonas sp.]
MKTKHLFAIAATGLALALPLFSGRPASAQDTNDQFQADLQKAMDTLNRLQQLLDQIANRQSSDQGNMNNSGGSDNSDSGNSDSN